MNRPQLPRGPAARGEPAIHPSTREFLSDVLAFTGRRRSASTFALILLGALMEGFGLALLVPMLALLTDDDGGRLARLADGILSFVGAETPLAHLAVLLAFFVVVMAARAIVIMARDVRLGILEFGFIERQRLRVMRALGAARWQDVAGTRHARITTALTVEVHRIAVGIQPLVRIGVAIVMLTTQLTLAVLIAPAVGLTALVLLGCGALILAVRLRHSRQHGEVVGNANMLMVDTVQQLLGGLKAAAAENMQDAFVTEFETTSVDLTRRQLAHRKRVTRGRVVISTVTVGAAALVLLAGFWLEGASVSLIAALAIVGRMSAPAMTVQQNIELIGGLIPAHASISRLVESLGSEASPARIASGSASLKGAIHLDDVSYAHADGAGVRDLTISIEPGEIVGVIGPSGAGKTTLMDLLAGLLEPRSGTIRIGSTNLDAAGRASWRNCIAYVGQDSYLSNHSIRRNLAWGRGDHDDPALWNALEEVGIAATVRTMPGELDTMVGERGARLSGGERQRIALARALLRKPELLLLDEATNAVDLEGERALLEALTRLDPRPAVVIVAHRAEALRFCDRVLTIKQGRLIGDAAVAPRANGLS